MFSIKHIASLLLFLLIYHSAVAKEKKIKGNAEVGINIATLYTGIPELQIGCFFKSYVNIDFGISTSAGYHLQPYESQFKEETPIDILLLKGAYYRLGIKARYPVTPGNQTHALWLQSSVFTQAIKNDVMMKETVR